MWKTSSGDRILRGAEADLIRESLSQVLYWLEMDSEGFDDPWAYSIPIFDRLDWRQKMALVSRVGAALLREDVPAPELSAVCEAAVGVLYENLRQCVQMEIDEDDPDRAVEVDRKQWRRLVLAAIQEVDTGVPSPDPDDQLPGVECDNMEAWELLIGTLETFVLWDDDWLDEDRFLDMEPAAAAALKERFSIADDYYQQVAPDPTETEMPIIREILQSLITELSAPPIAKQRTLF
jgi:hypothetical protein